jgi:hypothetical protein
MPHERPLLAARLDPRALKDPFGARNALKDPFEALNALKGSFRAWATGGRSEPSARAE